MPPEAPAGRRAMPARRGLRGTRGAVMPNPVLRAQGRASGLRARHATLRWGCRRRLPEGWAAAPAPALPMESSGVRHPSTRGPCSGSCPRVLGGCRDTRTGARTAGVSVTREHPGEALTAAPCCPHAPGSRWHGALPPTSPWKAGAGVPEDLRGWQPGLRSPGLPRGRLVPSPDREPSLARRSTLRGPQVMAWAQGAGKAQRTPCHQPKDGGPHKHREGERAVVLKVGIHPQEGSPASEARLLQRPRGRSPQQRAPHPPGSSVGLQPLKGRFPSVGKPRGARGSQDKPAGGSGWPRL